MSCPSLIGAALSLPCFCCVDYTDQRITDERQATIIIVCDRCGLMHELELAWVLDALREE